MKGYRRAIMALETASNPDFVGYHGVNTLRETDAEVLLVYSENDQLCKRNHFDLLKVGLSLKNNIRFLLLPNKGHNPNYTEDAVKYLGAYAKQKAKFKQKKRTTSEEKKAFLAQWDFHRMTAQDEAVWAEIFACLDR
jgi:hypothetical protein